ncbi:hypothetical protein, conserved [Plasmodium gonderi]|uniref:PCIF1 WW domain-containing protein n=1 Tax=Plasmodium gonderi TaxID=77519 RepID=A0A1Y1JGW2_PLAGO|nr:hypothetical protein, conserved [Plasmodium gonderi]GAW79683.1 hypothetical protein, conserved [Plasmodium gonderi]
MEDKMIKSSIVASPRVRLNQHEEYNFQKETIKIRKSFLNAYTFELFYAKNLKLKNEYLDIIKKENKKNIISLEKISKNGLLYHKNMLKRQIRNINRMFANRHHVSKFPRQNVIELNRHICFMEKEIINRFLFNLRINNSNYSFDEEEKYLYIIYSRFVHIVNATLDKKYRFFVKRKNIYRSNNKSSVRFDPYYIKQFCIFIRNLVKIRKKNSHFLFLKKYIQKCTNYDKTEAERGENSSQKNFRCYNVQVRIFKSGISSTSMNRCRGKKNISVIVTPYVESPSYNLSMHRENRSRCRSIGRSSGRSKNGQMSRMRSRKRRRNYETFNECTSSNSCINDPFKVNIQKVKNNVERFICSYLYDNILNSIFYSLFNRSIQFVCESVCESIVKMSHDVEGEKKGMRKRSRISGMDKDEKNCMICEKGQSETKPYWGEKTFSMNELTQIHLLKCLKIFFKPINMYQKEFKKYTQQKELILFENICTLLKDNVRTLLQLTVVNITNLCNHLPLQYFFSLFLFFFIFLRIPVQFSSEHVLPHWGLHSPPEGQQNRTEQNQAEQNQAEQNQAEQNRTEQNQAGQNRMEQNQREESDFFYDPRVNISKHSHYNNVENNKLDSINNPNNNPNCYTQEMKEESAFSTCLLCTYHGLKRNKNISIIDKKKYLAIIILKILQKNYEFVEKENSILELYFRSFMKNPFFNDKNKFLSVLFNIEKKKDDTLHEHIRFCCRDGKNKIQKRPKVGDAQEENTDKRINTCFKPHDIQIIFKRCMSRMNKKGSVLCRLQGLMGPEEEELLNGESDSARSGDGRISDSGGSGTKVFSLNHKVREKAAVETKTGKTNKFTNHSSVCGFSLAMGSQIGKGNSPREEYKKKLESERYNISSSINDNLCSNNIVRNRTPLDTYDNLEDKRKEEKHQRVIQKIFIDRTNCLYNYMYEKIKTFMENLKLFFLPLLNVLYRNSIFHVNMYIYMCMIESSILLCKKEENISKLHKRKEIKHTFRHIYNIESITMKNQNYKILKQECSFILFEEYFVCKFYQLLHLLHRQFHTQTTEKKNINMIIHYVKNRRRIINISFILLIYRLANVLKVQTWVNKGSQNVFINKDKNINFRKLKYLLIYTISMRMGTNLSMYNRKVHNNRSCVNNYNSRIFKSIGSRKNRKVKISRNCLIDDVQPYMHILLKNVRCGNHIVHAYLEDDELFYIQRKKDFIIFNLKNKKEKEETDHIDAKNVYYQMNGKKYFVFENSYMVKRVYKIKCVNVCLLFYRYCFFFYKKRNPLIFYFLFNNLFCICVRCLRKYLVLGKSYPDTGPTCSSASAATTAVTSAPATSAPVTSPSSTPFNSPPVEDSTHDCFYKQIGVLIKSRQNIFVRNFYCLTLFLIMRYHTLIGNVRHSGLQSCVPKRIFTLLRKTLEIKRECFSSPLNAVLSTYCSFFLDIDLFFGSSGNFFEFPLRDGAYEVNPPFDISLINKLIIYILCNLKKEVHELTFFLIIPIIKDKNYFFELLFSSPYLSTYFLLEQNSYTFSTRLFESREEEYISSCDCLVFILQNKKARLRKGVINKKVSLKIKKRWENLSHVKQKKGVYFSEA